MRTDLIKSGERLDDLQCKGFMVIQNPKEFCFGTDAVLLANFPEVKKNFNVLDLGTGTGVIPILLAAKTPAKHIMGIEIQSQMAEMAQRSIEYNNIEDRVNIINEDLRNAESFLPLSSFDLITCNPPYKSGGTGILNPDDSVAIARHEIKCTLEDIVRVSSRLLKFNGKLCIIHRPHRFIDIVCLMRQYKIEPKKAQFIHPSETKPPTMVLVEGARCGGEDFKVLKPLFIHDNEGNYTKDIYEIYYGGK